MANSNIIRVTKVQKLAAIKAALPAEMEHIFSGGENKEDFVFDYDAAVEFIDAELALLAKKNSGDKKPTKTQVENEQYKTLIVEYLGTQENGVTCDTIRKGVPALTDFSNQKVASLVKQLVTDNLLKKDVEKGKSLFSLA